MGRVPNTPGPAGYAVAWLVSVVGFGAFLGVGSVSEADQVLRAAVFWSWWVAWFSAPFAVAGIAAVDIGCRDVRAQWVHVAAAGLAGAVTGCVVALTLAFGRYEVIGVLAGVTALGRLVVVPLVWMRRREARDSARSPARC